MTCSSSSSSRRSPHLYPLKENTCGILMGLRIELYEMSIIARDREIHSSALQVQPTSMDLSFEASWNVFNGLLPGCLEKSSMSSLGGFLLLPIFINGQRRDPSLAIKAQGQRYIVYVHWTWAHCTTSLAYQVQLQRQKWPKMTIKGQTETYWLHYSLCFSAWLFIFEIIWQLILIGQLQL